MKAPLFGLIVLIVLSITGYLVWSTIITNVKSVTKGPVHYHADFEIWNCGQKIDLIDPHGLENKTGTPLFHEHNDNRIHVEGAISDYEDVSLGEFFSVVGGKLDSNALIVPTDSGMVNMGSGTMCKGAPGNLQIFVFKTEGKTFYQEKLVDPVSYVLSPHSQVPPGDCIIIEFDKPKDKTDKLCNFYKIAVEKGELTEVQNGN